MKNLTDFRILVETGGDPQLALLVILDLMRFCIHLTLFICCIIELMLILVFRPNINTSVVVQFLFSFVSNSLSFTSVPKNKGK